MLNIANRGVLSQYRHALQGEFEPLTLRHRASMASGYKRVQNAHLPHPTYQLTVDFCSCMLATPPPPHPL